MKQPQSARNSHRILSFFSFLFLFVPIVFIHFNAKSNGMNRKKREDSISQPIKENEKHSLWELQAVDTSTFSQSVFHTDVIPLSQRVSTRTQSHSKVNEQTQNNNNNNNTNTNTGISSSNMEAEITSASSSKSSPVSPLKLSQNIVSPHPLPSTKGKFFFQFELFHSLMINFILLFLAKRIPEKSTELTSKNATVIVLSPKKLQEQEDELNRMLDELEEDIHASQQHPKLDHCQSHPTETLKSQTEMNDNNDSEFFRFSLLQNEEQSLLQEHHHSRSQTTKEETLKITSSKENSKKLSSQNKSTTHNNNNNVSGKVDAKNEDRNFLHSSLIFFQNIFIVAKTKQMNNHTKQRRKCR
jgi:hypothetical protein